MLPRLIFLATVFDPVKTPPVNLKLVAVVALGVLATLSACESPHKESYRKAFNQHLARAAQGDAEAEFQVGKAYALGQGAAQDWLAATKWYRQAAEQGHAAAQTELGVCYHRGQGVDYDAAESVKWLRQAAAQDDAEAEAMLGLAWLQGRGVDESLDEAGKCLRKSAEHGNPHGIGLLLALEWLEALVEAKDLTLATKNLRDAAEAGNSIAQASLGRIYFEGQGVARDDQESLKWFRLAAHQDNAVAQSFLGLAYFYGHGVKQNYPQAVRWCRLGADQGNELAQQTLGLCYLSGKGVNADPAAAAKWFRQAAVQGNEDAQLSLGLAYHLGQGVRRDELEAYKWLDLAAVKGNATAISARAEAAQALTAAQLAQADAAPRRHLTRFNRDIIDAHRQTYDFSCIPSAVEMVLKLTGRVSENYYDQQNEWKNKTDGSFHNFDGKTIAGITFHSSFWDAHGREFPLERLFQTIESELQAGRFVIVGLSCSGGTHDWVIYDENTTGDFLAISKAGERTIEDNHVRRTITHMQGTDIGTYEVQP
jgi:TPR repeat protein